MPQPVRMLISTVFVMSAGPAGAQPGAEMAPEPAPPVPDASPEMTSQPAPPEARQPPPGSTQAIFVSTAAQPWEVLLDREPVCQTPCSTWVPPMRFVTLRSIERAPVLLDVGYLPRSPTIVSGKPLETGKYAAGITFTTLSGMGLVTGIALAAVGCTTDHDGLCKAGVITGVPSAIGLYLSIQLMRSAVPKATIGPATPYAAGNTVGLAGTF
jgi:hypothetical protein